MTTVDSHTLDRHRPSALRLLGAQVVYQLRLLVRSPLASFATLVIPLMVLLAVNLLFSGTAPRRCLSTWPDGSARSASL